MRYRGGVVAVAVWAVSGPWQCGAKALGWWGPLNGLVYRGAAVLRAITLWLSHLSDTP
ncbi:transposase, IS4 family protein [Mycobacterium europaeum]|uniref:Transposase, IS4 family protein n=1 Tax=Mycobacterium europaeum TaxID=761804 RepID=A0A0U1DAQ8_9MYCO|nr:transposase, IS4 family protein [Mycobacterium europaeum]